MLNAKFYGHVAFGLVLAISSVREAHADGGVLTAQVVVKVANFVIDFLDAAKSNASAVAEVNATSISEGTVTDKKKDTGYFRATVNTEVVSGQLAEASAYADAQYNFFSANVHTIAADKIVIPTDGVSANWNAGTNIKGALQVLKEAIGVGGLTTPMSLDVLPTYAEALVPVHFSFDLNKTSSYQFSVSISPGDEGGVPVDLVRGSVAWGASDILFPYIENVDPTLANALRAQFLDIVGRSGPVSFDMGDGILPRSTSGVSGLPVTIQVGSAFELDSVLNGQGAVSAVPEPSAWFNAMSAMAVLAFVRKRSKDRDTQRMPGFGRS